MVELFLALFDLVQFGSEDMWYAGDSAFRTMDMPLLYILSASFWGNGEPVFLFSSFFDFLCLWMVLSLICHCPQPWRTPQVHLVKVCSTLECFPSAPPPTLSSCCFIIREDLFFSEMNCFPFSCAILIFFFFFFDCSCLAFWEGSVYLRESSQQLFSLCHLWPLEATSLPWGKAPVYLREISLSHSQPAADCHTFSEGPWEWVC